MIAAWSLLDCLEYFWLVCFWLLFSRALLYFWAISLLLLGQHRDTTPRDLVKRVSILFCRPPDAARTNTVTRSLHTSTYIHSFDPKKAANTKLNTGWEQSLCSNESIFLSCCIANCIRLIQISMRKNIFSINLYKRLHWNKLKDQALWNIWYKIPIDHFVCLYSLFSSTVLHRCEGALKSTAMWEDLVGHSGQPTSSICSPDLWSWSS